MTLTFAEPAHFWFLIGAIVLVLVFVFVGLGEKIAIYKGDWLAARQTVRNLAELDPTLLEVFGRDTFDRETWREVRRIDAGLVDGFVQIQRSLRQRGADTAALDEALAALAAARRAK